MVPGGGASLYKILLSTPVPRSRGVQLFKVFQTVVLLAQYTVESRFLERSVC